MTATQEDIYSEIKISLSQAGLYSADGKGSSGENTWRISTEPYLLSAEELGFIDRLGDHLLEFYTVLNQFYLDSAKGKIPRWISEYLDFGKPSHLVDYGRMKRFRKDLPGIRGSRY